MTVATQTQTQTCYRCGGKGLIPAYKHVLSGKCFRCKGSGVEPVKAKTPVLRDPETFKVLDQLGHNTGEIAKTESESEVRRYRGLLVDLIEIAKGSEYYAPNVYAALIESIDRVIEIRFGATAPADTVEEVEVVEDAAVPTIPTGTYSIERADGSHFTFRISEAKKGRLSGRFLVEQLVGPDNGLDFVTFGFVNANPGRLTINVWKKFERGVMVEKAREIEVVMNGEGLEDAGIRYAVQSSRCRRCNRVLTVPASIHQGYGPDCINKV